jgi:hypothetical protein
VSGQVKRWKGYYVLADKVIILIVSSLLFTLNCRWKISEIR